MCKVNHDWLKNFKARHRICKLKIQLRNYQLVKIRYIIYIDFQQKLKIIVVILFIMLKEMKLIVYIEDGCRALIKKTLASKNECAHLLQNE